MAEAHDKSGTPPRIRMSVIKADNTISNLMDLSAEDEQVFNEAGGIKPYYDPKTLNRLFEHSNALRQNVDAYATNIDGHGHTFDPVIDLEADDTNDRVRAVMQLEQQARTGATEVPDPTDAEVEARKKKLADEQRIELLRLQAFFDYCSETSFTDLRRKTRQDIETTGNGYWEVLRNAKGEIAQFNYIESHTMRLTALDTEFTQYPVKRRLPTQQFENTTARKRFRRYIQKVGKDAVFFKEFGDPRTISARTGKAFKDVSALELEEKHRASATEVVHFKIHSSSTPYGVPRWIGNLLSVLGSRSCEEVNFSYFENKSVPPLAILVSGGRLAEDSVTRLQDYIKNEIRGKDNFHKILVIEAQADSGNPLDNQSGNASVKLEPLTQAQSNDALFQDYDERNIDKVGMAFRLPRMLRGDTRDFNRSTSFAALDFAERQVFNPERTSFDYWMNRHILPDLGIRHWKLKSNGPTQRDPESLAKMIHDLQDVFPLNTLMELAQPVFGRNFSRIDHPWADQPLKLTLAQIATANNAGDASGASAPDMDSPAAEDADPENQDGSATGAEAESSRTEEADNAPNKSPDASNQQPRDAGGRFGSSRRGKPRRVRTRKQVEETLSTLLEVRESLLKAASEEAAERIRAAREVDGVDD